MGAERTKRAMAKTILRELEVVLRNCILNELIVGIKPGSRLAPSVMRGELAYSLILGLNSRTICFLYGLLL